MNQYIIYTLEIINILYKFRLRLNDQINFCFIVCYKEITTLLFSFKLNIKLKINCLLYISADKAINMLDWYMLKHI